MNLLEEGCIHWAVFPALEERAWGLCTYVPLSEGQRELASLEVELQFVSWPGGARNWSPHLGEEQCELLTISLGVQIKFLPTLNGILSPGPCR